MVKDQSAMEEIRPLEKGIVLIVDDNQSNREMCGINLEREGFSPFFARDGGECLDVAKKIMPDVILLDVVMPVMDGFEVLEKLREDSATSEIPVLMLTVKSETKNIVKALKLGANDYLKKPFEMDELIARIEKLVGLKNIMSSLGEVSENLRLRTGQLESELKKGLAETSALKKYLTHSQKMEALATLSKGIAHDFNNLLFLIMGYIDMTMFDFSGDPVSADNLEKAMRAAKRAKHLLGRIVAFNAPENRELMPVKLQTIVVETLEIITSTLPSEITITTDINMECASVMCLPSHIYQVIITLCMNACHAMQEKSGHIEVGLNELEISSAKGMKKLNLPPGKYIKLTVADTGADTGGEKANVRLEKACASSPEATQARDGTEIGLMLVCDIVKKLNGVMTTEAGADRTTYCIYLPVVG
ncbi:MAG: response regulator [Deltaproteobacteria bacterium]|nr:response regulator [Deltaproteobacteria bacterium]